MGEAHAQVVRKQCWYNRQRTRSKTWSIRLTGVVCVCVCVPLSLTLSHTHTHSLTHSLSLSLSLSLVYQATHQRKGRRCHGQSTFSFAPSSLSLQTFAPAHQRIRAQTPHRGGKAAHASKVQSSVRAKCACARTPPPFTKPTRTVFDQKHQFPLPSTPLSRPLKLDVHAFSLLHIYLQDGLKRVGTVCQPAL